MKKCDLIISHLRECIGQLESTIECLESGLVRHRHEPLQYNEGHLQIDLAHAYHHMNFAWHIRNVRLLVGVGISRIGPNSQPGDASSWKPLRTPEVHHPPNPL